MEYSACDTVEEWCVIEFLFFVICILKPSNLMKSQFGWTVIPGTQPCDPPTPAPPSPPAERQLRGR